MSRVYPDELKEAERKLVEKRRAAALPGGGQGWVGFALSGGGIRSATFCLGIFQALARRALIARIDFLSTVSGGGYFGSCLGALFSEDRVEARRRLREGLKLPDNVSDVRTVEAALGEPRSAVLGWLRQNGRYLSPVGAGDALLTAAIYLRNLAALHLVLGVALLAVFLVGATVSFWIQPSLANLGIRGVFEAPLVTLSIWWSPWLLAALVPLCVVAVPSGWAYWLTQRGLGGRRTYWTLAVTIWVALACFLPVSPVVPSALTSLLSGWRVVRLIVGTMAVLAAVFWLVDEHLAVRNARQEEGAGRLLKDGRLEYQLLLVRNRLSQWTKRGITAAAALLAFGLVDSLGQSLHLGIADQGLLGFLSHAWTWPPIAAVLATLAASQRLLAMIPTRARLRVPVELIAWIAAVLVGTTLLTAWAAVAHALAWNGHPLRDDWPAPGLAAAGALVAILLSLLFSRTMQFLNNSSNHAWYAARLTRAYVGASNKVRWTDEGARVGSVLPGDAIPMSAYRPFEYGGPLHLINVTLNETIGGRDETEYRDRKGMGMAIGPAGVSVAASHHALWTAGGRMEDGLGPASQLRPTTGVGFHPLFPVDRAARAVQSRLLGQWTAISGAAFTTGLGARTSLPLGLLLGLANVRLGYWWDSRFWRFRSSPRGVIGWVLDTAIPVHTGLFDELIGRYWGPAKRYWYLSDGGHFENTACYELIRRRLPLIICCDCGADPEYTWADLSNLVLKARIDFDAEIRFLEGTGLTKEAQADRRRELGELPQIHRTGSEAHAIVGHVYYLDCPQKREAFDAGTLQPDSVLLVIKPSLTGDEPEDVLEYARSHSFFPQEPTFDQYFDEAQWESYRKLGEHIGSQLFREGEPWCPVSVPAQDAKYQ